MNQQTSNYLTVDQQRLINMYVAQYNHTNNHIERLMDMLDDIRNNIQSVIIGNNYSRPNRANRFNRNNRYSTNYSSNYLNTYINSLLNDRNTNTNNIFPINETVYTRLFNRYPQSQTNNTSSIYNNFLNSVVAVRPTREQIERATRVVRYGDIPNPLSLTCPISLDAFNDTDAVRQIRYCEHIFSQSQFNQWFNTNVRCPVCRYDIRNYAANDTAATASSGETNMGLESEQNQGQEQETIEEPRIATDRNVEPNIVRNPVTNQIDHLTFDITGTTLANNLLQNFTSQMFQSLLSTDASNNLFVDPSFNTILFDAIVGSFNNI